MNKQNKKHILYTILLLIIGFNCFSQNLLREIEVNKLKSTISLKVNEFESIHFLIKKNKKELEFLPYLISDTVKELKSFTINSSATILSKHVYKDKVVIVYKQYYWVDTKELFDHYLIEYNFNTEKASKPKLLRNFQSKIIKTDNAIFFIKKKDSNLILQRIQSLEKNDLFSFKLKEDEIDLISTNLNFINLKLYPFGPIQSSPFYYINNNVVITIEDRKNNSTFVFKFDLSNPPLSERNFSVSIFKNSLEKNKVLKSFLIDDKLFQFAINKGFKTAQLNVFNLETNKIIKIINYSEEDFKHYNNFYEGIKEVTPDENDFFKIYKNLNSIFITVKKNLDSVYEINIGSIANNKISTYNNLNQFGSSVPTMQISYNSEQLPYGTNSYFNDQLLEFSDNKHLVVNHFTLLLDIDLNKIDSESKNILNNFNNQEKIELARQRNIKKRDRKYRSYISLKNKFRFIEYVSSKNMIYFYEY
jgi:hypothetical protein